MDRIGIRDLRADLSTWVRRAEAGSRVVVTIDGEPVAQLGPLDAGGPETTIDDLVARGLLDRARRDDRPPPTFTMPVWAGTRLDQLTREVRGR